MEPRPPHDGGSSAARAGAPAAAGRGGSDRGPPVASTLSRTPAPHPDPPRPVGSLRPRRAAPPLPSTRGRSRREPRGSGGPGDARGVRGVRGAGAAVPHPRRRGAERGAERGAGAAASSRIPPPPPPPLPVGIFQRRRGRERRRGGVLGGSCARVGEKGPPLPTPLSPDRWGCRICPFTPSWGQTCPPEPPGLSPCPGDQSRGGRTGGSPG